MGTSATSVQRSPHLRIHCINVFVRDQDRSLRFFVDQLGFNVAFDTRGQTGERWVGVAPPDGSAILALIQPEPNSPQSRLIGRATNVVFVTEDVTAKFLEWSRRGVRFSSTPRLRRVQYHLRPPLATGDQSSSEPGHEQEHEAPVWGGVAARFRDLDGNTFSLVSFDELTRELEEQRRAIAAKQEVERRAAHELEIAKGVQARLFPQTLPPLKTLEYAGMCIQARQVGGDYYDFLELGGGRVGFVIGDVAGKGIAAALLMANLQANLRSLAAFAQGQPERILCSVNQLFCENTTDGAYATLFFAEYEDKSRILRYANCGHLPALVLRANGEVERLPATATVLGIFKKWDCLLGECQLGDSDVLALYTDGVTESFNGDGEEFGEERLVAALQRQRALSPYTGLTAIVEEVTRFSPGEQHDDITVILAHCKPS